MTDYDLDKVSPGDWRVIWRDDESSMNMGVIVDGSYGGDSGNIDDYYNLPQSSVVCVFFHQSEPIIGKHECEDYDGYTNAVADAAHIVHCVNNHDPLVVALERIAGEFEGVLEIIDAKNLDVELGITEVQHSEVDWARKTLADAKGE